MQYHGWLYVCLRITNKKMDLSLSLSPWGLSWVDLVSSPENHYNWSQYLFPFGGCCCGRVFYGGRWVEAIFTRMIFLQMIYFLSLQTRDFVLISLFLLECSHTNLIIKRLSIIFLVRMIMGGTLLFGDILLWPALKNSELPW